MSGVSGLRSSLAADGLAAHEFTGSTTAATVLTAPSVAGDTMGVGAAASTTAATTGGAGDRDRDAQASDSDELDSAFEGESSLAAHTAFASEFLEQAVGRSSSMTGITLNPSMEAALSSLQQIVGMQHRQSSSHVVRFPHQKPFPRGGFKELPMPPLQIVVALLRAIKGAHDLCWILLMEP